MKTIATLSTESFIQTNNKHQLITLESGAQFEHFLIGNCGAITVHVKKDALYSPLMFSSNEDEQKIDLTIYLEEPGAEVDLKGLLKGNSKQEILNTVTVHHKAEATSSHQYLKSLADNDAQINLVSNVKIEENTKQSSATQLSKCLLLSETATISAKPNLEIDHDDITASHGASIGALNPEALFFLQSRGLPEVQAKELLLTAFSNEILELIHNEQVLELISV
jgi:Fe-S cluster assembly protein SufD